MPGRAQASGLFTLTAREHCNLHASIWASLSNTCTRMLAAMLRPRQAQQRAQEASAREATANAKVLSREVEIGALKGEIAVLKTQTATQVRAG